MKERVDSANNGPRKPMIDPPFASSGSFLIYDGDCPVCANYVLLAGLRQKIPDLQLISARDAADPRVRQAWDTGIDLNEEMALFYAARWYIGAEAMLMLCETGKVGFFDRFVHAFLGGIHTRQNRYRFLVALRKTLLRLLSRKEIEPPPKK